MSLEPVQVNGGPALIVRLNGEIDGVVAIRLEDGLVTWLYLVRNPEELSRVEREPAVSRSTRGSLGSVRPVRPGRSESDHGDHHRNRPHGSPSPFLARIVVAKPARRKWSP